MQNHATAQRHTRAQAQAQHANMPTVPHGPLSLSLALSLSLFLALSPSPSQRIQQMRIMSYHVLPLHRPTAQARRCNKEAWHFPSSLAGKKHICQLVKVCSTAFLHADCLPAGFDVGFLICLTAICTRADFSTFLYGLFRRQLANPRRSSMQLGIAWKSKFSAAEQPESFDRIYGSGIRWHPIWRLAELVDRKHGICRPSLNTRKLLDCRPVNTGRGRDWWHSHWRKGCAKWPHASAPQGLLDAFAKA